MDTFSLSIIYGTLNIDKKRIILLSIIVGLFHFFMPLIGTVIGSVIMSHLPVGADILEGIIFLVLGIQMLISLNKDEEIKAINGMFSMLLFGFTVSIDSLTVGVGLEAITKNYFLASFTFMIISFLFTMIGLIIGKKLSERFGRRAIILGSIILLILAMIHIF